MEDIRFLLVDDRADVRAALRRLISTWPGGNVVAEAENGEDALRLVALHRPHIVFMDIVMPVMDGFQAAEQMKTLYPDLRIVLYTGHSKERFQQRARDVGIDAVYMKEELTLSEFQRLLSQWFNTSPQM